MGRSRDGAPRLPPASRAGGPGREAGRLRGRRLLGQCSPRSRCCPCPPSSRRGGKPPGEARGGGRRVGSEPRPGSGVRVDASGCPGSCPPLPPSAARPGPPCLCPSLLSPAGLPSLPQHLPQTPRTQVCGSGQMKGLDRAPGTPPPHPGVSGLRAGVILRGTAAPSPAEGQHHTALWQSSRAPRGSGAVCPTQGGPQTGAGRVPARVRAGRASCETCGLGPALRGKAPDFRRAGVGTSEGQDRRGDWAGHGGPGGGELLVQARSYRGFGEEGGGWLVTRGPGQGVWGPGTTPPVCRVCSLLGWWGQT